MTFARVRSLAIDEGSVPVAVEVEASVRDVPLRARVLARRTLGTGELALVLAMLALSVALVLALAFAPAEDGMDHGERGALRAVIGVLAIVCAAWVLGALGPAGPTFGLGAGLVLAAVELAAALILVRARASRRAALGMARAPGGLRTLLVWLALSPVVGLALFAAARAALALVPSTGEAPIEAFVRWPSGMLSFALLAVVAPVAEEVFFRGFVFSALRGEGGTSRVVVAVVASWLLFGVAHAPQDWGNWGGLAAVMIAGLGFTLMRAASGSTLAPCVAHLVYNGLLATSALVAGAS